MAKHPDKTPLPEDDQPLLPESRDDLEAAALDEIELAESASQVNLGAEPPSAEPSEVSMTGWADLVDELAAPAADEPLVVDADEDAEILSDSAVDLGATPEIVEEELLPASSGVLLDEDVPLALDEEDVDLGSPGQLPTLPDVTGVNLADADVLEPEIIGEASAVDLSGEELLDPEVVESSSGISIHDMGLEEVPGEQVAELGEDAFENSGELVLEEIVQQESGNVELGEEVLLGGESPSQRDLIAEAVESGVDLPTTADLAPTEGDSEVRLDEQLMLADDVADDELAQKMDDLGASDEHTSLNEEIVQSETMEYSSIDHEPSSDRTEMVNFDAPAEDDVLKTGGRIPRPDSLGEMEWDDGVAGETPSATNPEDMSMFEEVVYSDPDQAPLEEPLDMQEEEEPAPQPVPEKGKKGKKGTNQKGLEQQFADPDEPEPKEKKKEKPAKPRGRAGAWVGGTLLGLILGGGGVIGAALYGYDPTPTVGNLVGIAPPDKGVKLPPKPKPTANDVAEALRNGDLEKALLVSSDIAPATKEEYATRGELRFKSHLQKQAAANKAVQLEDEAVKEAVEDLKQSDTAEAALALAQIHIQAGKLPEAEKILTDAAGKFKDDRRIAAALTRLQFLKDDKAPVGGGGARLDLEHALLAVLLGVQPPGPGMPEVIPPMPMPMPGGPPPVVETPEAGFEFWQAMKLAREQKFSEARTALVKAIELHEKRRLQRLNKAQNPESDPYEDIFLRACKELTATWEAQESLKKGNFLAEKGDLRQAVAAAIKSAADSKRAVISLATKLVDAKVIDNPNDFTAGLDKVLADRKADGEKLVMLTKDLTDAKKANEELKTEVTTTKKLADDLATKLTAAEKLATDTKAERDGAFTTLDTGAKLLVDAKVIDKPERGELLKGLREVIKTAEMKDPTGAIRSLTKEVGDLKAASAKSLADQKTKHDKDTADLLKKQADAVTALKDANAKQVNGLTAQLKESRRAAEVMPTYLKALQERGTGLEATALEDVARVGRDALATPVEKANAGVIRGLVLRNQAKYAEAKTALEPALKDVPKESPFFVAGNKALAEATDPAKFVAEQVAELQGRGEGEQALKLLQASLPALPLDAQNRLLATRALLQLDELRRLTGGRFKLEDPALLAAQKDAAASDAAGTAEGSYAVGRIAEELGQFTDASTKYREAITRHGKNDAVGARYRIALSRSLIQASQPWTPPGGNTKPKPLEGKVGALPGLREMLLLMTLGLQPGDLLGSPNRAEAIKLADEILLLGDKAPFDARAQALAVKGRWTEALTLYAEGLRGHLKGDLSDGLLLLIRNHPALKKDDADRINPVEAERLYGQAVRLYFLRDFAEAEKLFLLSLENYDQDARTFYFLGLARLAQGKTDLAYASFESGAQLERGGKPGKGVINTALERIQGTERRMLGQVRDRIER